MIVPGLINTGITVHALLGDGSVSGKMQTAVANGMSPEKCAKKILNAVANQKNEAVIGGKEIYSVWIKRFFPGIWDYWVRNHPLKTMRSLQFQFGKK
jgi:short-subunit dehydrogenase